MAMTYCVYAMLSHMLPVFQMNHCHFMFHGFCGMVRRHFGAELELCTLVILTRNWVAKRDRDVRTREGLICGWLTMSGCCSGFIIVTKGDFFRGGRVQILRQGGTITRSLTLSLPNGRSQTIRKQRLPSVVSFSGAGIIIIISLLNIV